MSKLEIKDIHIKIEDKQIVKGVSMTIKSGEVHAIMGPNGTGKSTLAAAIMGHPLYDTEGTVLLDKKNILELAVDERAKAGLFLAMQYPAEISGVKNSDFMRQAIRETKEEDRGIVPFIMEYEKNVADLKMREDLPFRYVNEGFSGGERKRNEILQLKMLKPKFAILDEIDSGLDIDALKIVGSNVAGMVENGLGVLLITHYQRILDYIKPTHVHIMVDGKIVQSGGNDLIEKIENEGYTWLNQD